MKFEVAVPSGPIEMIGLQCARNSAPLRGCQAPGRAVTRAVGVAILTFVDRWASTWIAQPSVVEIFKVNERSRQWADVLGYIEPFNHDRWVDVGGSKRVRGAYPVDLAKTLQAATDI